MSRKPRYIFLSVILAILLALSRFTSDINPREDIIGQCFSVNALNQVYQLYYHENRLSLIQDQETVYEHQLADYNKIIDLAVGDVDGNGDEEILVLYGAMDQVYGSTFVIFDVVLEEEQAALRLRYENQMEKIQPWMLEVCEIDGDGQLEIFLGVHKATLFYPEPDHRPFFFNFQDEKLIKKWTGSKVRNPFTDVFFIDLNGDGIQEIVFLESLGEEKQVLALYYWFGFGFVLFAESEAYDGIERVEIGEDEQGPYLKARVREGSTERVLMLSPSQEKTEQGINLLKERGR